MKNCNALVYFLTILISSCAPQEIQTPAIESEPSSSHLSNAIGETNLFTLTGSIDLGPTGAAEISDYDPMTKKLFVVNNTNNNNRIDVLNLSNPSIPLLMTSIVIAPFGGLVNSVSVNSGRVAASIEAVDKVSAGKVVIFNTTTLQVIKEVTVGSLPDMVTFTPDGLYLLSANEGEPNADYSIDPIGSVSIIDVTQDYAVTTLDFSKFKNIDYKLAEKGFRIFGPKASFAQDIEPEYITVASNSRTAWVTLQENNAFAQINVRAKEIAQIFPLGFKNHKLQAYAMDASDQDGGTNIKTFPVRGMYEPDGIAVMDFEGQPFLFTANEGDSREYSTYVENVRFGSSGYKIDASSMPFGAAMKANTALGRLNVSTAIGDYDKDGDFDEIYTHGGRSFTIWNGRSGDWIYDSFGDLDQQAIKAGKYPDSRSDDKGTEPETVVLGKIGNQNLLFVGLERANAVVVYDVTNPLKPNFLQWINTAVGPEGVVFVPATNSPTGKNLLIVSCETDGVVMIFSMVNSSGAAF